MAWTKSSEGDSKNPKKVVWSQDLVVKQVGSSVEGHNWSSVIDFVPPGTDFTVIANTAATNTSASSPVMLYVGYSRTAAVTARYRKNVTPFISLTSEVDSSTPNLHYDVSANGEYPYYWLKIPTAGGNINVKVMVGNYVV